MVATVSKISSAAQAANYYYQKDPLFKENGTWYGKGAERLGLTGAAVDHSLFKNMVSGKIPVALLPQEQQNDYRDNRSFIAAAERFAATAAEQSHPFSYGDGTENGLRTLSACGLATSGKTERAGVLLIDARPDRSELDVMRRSDREQLEQLKAEKFEEFVRIHRGGLSQRPGVDITFSAPKSFSIAMVSPEFAHLDLAGMHRTAVAEALDFLQESAGCRVTKDGVTHDILTGEYIIALHDHSTARPVSLEQVDELGEPFAALAADMRAKGQTTITDIDLHTHAFIINATYCEETQSWKAMDNSSIMKDQKLAGAIHANVLAQSLREQGVELRYGPNGWEIAAISQKLIEGTSLRKAVVDHYLEEKGLTRETATDKQKQAANKNTRLSKDPAMTGKTLTKEFQDRVAIIEREQGVTIKEALAGGFPEDKTGPRTGREGVESGLRHFMQNESIIKESDVIKWAVANARGYYSLKEVRSALAEMKASGEILSGEMKRDENSPGYALALKAGRDARATDKQIATANRIAEQKGIEAPTSGRMEDYRKFLDEHSGQKIGFKEDQEKEGGAGAMTNTRPGDTILTTKEAQQREQDMLNSVISGRGTMPAVMTRPAAQELLISKNLDMQKTAIAKAIESGKAPTEAKRGAAKLGLNEGQMAVANLILTSSDRVNVILGVAGSGKSFTLGQAKTVLENGAGLQLHQITASDKAKKAGLKMHGVAPSHQAKNELKEVTGSGDTLQSFLAKTNEWKKLGTGHVLIVDEAGMASTRQMAALEEISKKQGFRYFLVGDNRQTTAVEAGKPLAQIEKVMSAGESKAEMNDSVRHKNAELANVAKLAANINTMGAAFDDLLARGKVIEIKDDAARYKFIADRAIEVKSAAEAEAKAAGKTPEAIQKAGIAALTENLNMSTTNAAVRAINGHVRESLGLAGAGREINTLTAVNTSTEERKFLSTYKPGHVLNFTAEYKLFGVKKNDRLTVAEVNGDHLLLSDRQGKTHIFRPANFNTERWNLFKPGQIELAAGDRVRMRETREKQGFQNGDWGKVISIDEKTVQIQSERDPKKIWDINHDEKELIINHGYAMTAHGAQGATRDGAICEFNHTSPVLCYETAYVPITRARHDSILVVSDIERVKAKIGIAATKRNALDFDQHIKSPDKAKEKEADYDYDYDLDHGI